MTALTQALAAELVAAQGASVVIPSTYTSIDDLAFFSMFALDSIEIPESIVSIGDYAFKGNNLTEVTIPESVESIGQASFSENKLKKITIPSSLSSIPYRAFAGNELTSIDIHSGITTIGAEAFKSNSIERVTIPENVSSLGDNAFDPNTVIVNLSNGKVIGPNQSLYDILQGVSPGSTTSNKIVRGSETLGTRDIFLLPNISSYFISTTFKGGGNVATWSFDTGFADNNDYFLIDSKVDISKVVQFANCIWYDEGWERDPLLDTRNDPKYETYPFSEGDNFEMAFYADWNRTAPQPSQFGSIDLSGIDLNLIQGMSDDDFLEEYAYAITAFDPTSDLAKEIGNPTSSGVGGSSSSGSGGSSSSGSGGGSSSSVEGSSSTTSESSTTQEPTLLASETSTENLAATTPQAITPITTKTVVDIKIEEINIKTLQEKEVSTFALTEPVQVGREGIETLIVGTKKKDKITGSSEGEVLSGGEGKDVLSGGEGADGFLFQNPEGFGKKEADKITDFDADEGDSVLVDKAVFDLGRKVKFKSVTGKKATKKASKSNKEFVYDGNKGLLYFNENGKAKGWGDDGGLFTKLIGAPELGASDFTIV